MTEAERYISHAFLTTLKSTSNALPKCFVPQQIFRASSRRSSARCLVAFVSRTR
jgi:hypothetical protein